MKSFEFNIMTEYLIAAGVDRNAQEVELLKNYSKWLDKHYIVSDCESRGVNTDDK